MYIDFTIDWVGYNSHVMSADFSKLKDALARVGMTQAELARQIGVTRAAVSNWIQGRAAPSLGHLFEIARVLNMTTSEILGDEVLFAETKLERDTIEALREMTEAEREQILRMVKLLRDNPPETDQS